MRQRSPLRISKEIVSLCKEIVSDPQPRFLKVAPVPEADSNECFPAVARQIEIAGGAVCYGWRIWELPRVFIEAEFHAVWRNPEGELCDITPAPQGISRILFLPDAGRVYEGRQVRNVRRPITAHPEIKEFFQACDDEFELMNRGTRANEHGAITLEDAEAEDLYTIEMRKTEAITKILQGLPRIGRNDPCPCGSGKMYKKCCYGYYAS
jgi:hypothetical protein